MRKKKKKKKITTTRNVSIWHRCPLPGPSSPTCRHFAKNEVEKRAITLIIIGRFYPKSNLTIFYDYIPVYKIWIQYIKNLLKKKYRKENIFWRWKRAITTIIIGWFYPNWNLTSILWLYTCVFKYEFNTLMFSCVFKYEFNTLMFLKDIKLKLFFNVEKGP